MNFQTGEIVWVYYNKRSNGSYASKRKGRIVDIYNKFICVYIFAKSAPNSGWCESFLKTDIFITQECKLETIETDKQKKNKSRKIAAI